MQIDEALNSGAWYENFRNLLKRKIEKINRVDFLKWILYCWVYGAYIQRHSKLKTAVAVNCLFKFIYFAIVKCVDKLNEWAKMIELKLF